MLCSLLINFIEDIEIDGMFVDLLSSFWKKIEEVETQFLDVSVS